MCHSQYMLIEHVARCIDSSGTREFFEPFFEMLHDFFGVDQCMIFLLDPQSKMQCLLSRNFLNNGVAAPLAKAYIEDGYNADPNLATLNKLSLGDAQTIHFSDMKHQIPEDYRKQFFAEPDLVDKVSILTADDCGKYYINFYRSEGRPSFLQQQLFANPAEGRLIASVIAQHYRLNRSLSEEGPLAFLSDREREVCQGILQGKKMEAVSLDMGVATSSAITYKKRAYVKLGITSRTSLFALCGRS